MVFVFGAALDGMRRLAGLAEGMVGRQRMENGRREAIFMNRFPNCHNKPSTNYISCFQFPFHHVPITFPALEVMEFGLGSINGCASCNNEDKCNSVPSSSVAQWFLC